MDLTICIVNYNSHDYLLSCLRSIYGFINKIKSEIIVVDNNSTDRSVEIISQSFPEVLLIRNNANIGFAKANNQAIKQSRGRYILLLNPDTQIINGSMEEMVNYLEKNHNIGVLGCKILNQDGSLQISTFGYPSLIKEFFNITSLGNIFPPNSFFRKLLGRNFSKIFKNTLSRYWNHDENREVDYVMGACLMARRDAIDEVGLLDENFFMYVEDAEWCYRFKKLGWQVHYNPNMCIIHHANRTCSADLDLNKELFIEYYKGIIYFFQKHYKKIKQYILRGMLIFICSLRIIIEKIKEIFLMYEKEEIKDNIIKYTAIRRLAINYH